MARLKERAFVFLVSSTFAKWPKNGTRRNASRSVSTVGRYMPSHGAFPNLTANALNVRSQRKFSRRSRSRRIHVQNGIALHVGTATCSNSSTTRSPKMDPKSFLRVSRRFNGAATGIATWHILNQCVPQRRKMNDSNHTESVCASAEPRLRQCWPTRVACDQHGHHFEHIVVLELPRRNVKKFRRGGQAFGSEG